MQLSSLISREIFSFCVFLVTFSRWNSASPAEDNLSQFTNTYKTVAEWKVHLDSLTNQPWAAKSRQLCFALGHFLFIIQLFLFSDKFRCDFFSFARFSLSLFPSELSFNSVFMLRLAIAFYCAVLRAKENAFLSNVSETQDRSQTSKSGWCTRILSSLLFHPLGTIVLKPFIRSKVLLISAESN